MAKRVVSDNIYTGKISLLQLDRLKNVLFPIQLVSLQFTTPHSSFFLLFSAIGGHRTGTTLVFKLLIEIKLD